MRRREFNAVNVMLLAVLTGMALWLFVSGLYMVAFLHSWWVYL